MGEPVALRCKVCGAAFEVPLSRGQYPRTCSHACAHAWRSYTRLRSFARRYPGRGEALGPVLRELGAELEAGA